MSFLNWLFDTVLPATCVICQRKTHREISLCQKCVDTLPHIEHACPRCGIPQVDHHTCPRCWLKPPTYQKVYCPFIYRDHITRFVSELKFSSRLLYANILADLLAEYLVGKLTVATLPKVIIPVPLHRWRIKQRGFNQAVEIGRRLSRRFDIPLDYSLLVRHKATLPQSMTKASQREKNVNNAFTVMKPLPNHVVVLDDVVTTGSTIEAISKALKRQGAEQIDIWCCARTALIR